MKPTATGIASTKECSPPRRSAPAGSAKTCVKRSTRATFRATTVTVGRQSNGHLSEVTRWYAGAWERDRRLG